MAGGYAASRPALKLMDQPVVAPSALLPARPAYNRVVDADAVAAVRNALEGTLCTEAHSTNGLRSGAFEARFNLASLSVTCEWNLHSLGLRRRSDANPVALVGARVVEVRVDPKDHTLTILFEGQMSFWAKPDSPVHESWVLSMPDGQMIVVGPGSAWARFPARA